MVVRSLLIAAVTASALAAVALYAPPPAAAAPVPDPSLSVTGEGTSMIEGESGHHVKFTVTNTSADNLILDYALATIFPGPPDLTDMAIFAGVTAPTEIAPNGGTGVFDYTVDAPGSPDGADFGVNPVTFYIEMSPFNGPNPTPAITVKGNGVFVFPAPPTGQTPNPVVLAELNACINNPSPANCPAPTDLLYTNGRVGDPFPATTTVIVSDPEPSSLAIAATGVLALLGFAWRPRREN